MFFRKGEGMKKLCVLILLLPTICFADSASISQLTDLVNNASGNADFEEIEMVVKKENAELYSYLDGKTTEEKIPFYKSWLSEKIYNSILNNYLEEMKKIAKETGRELDEKTIKKTDCAKITNYELADSRIKTEYISQYDVDVTYYPDDYEEFRIRLSENTCHEKKSFSIVKDNKDTNESVFVQVSLSKNTSFDDFEEDVTKFKSFYMIGVSANTTDYDKLMKLRKDTADDLKNGMMVPYNGPCSGDVSKTCKKWKCSGNCEDWNSSKWYVGDIYNFVVQNSFNYSATSNK